jgi:hypothetical protein
VLELRAVRLKQQLMNDVRALSNSHTHIHEHTNTRAHEHTHTHTHKRRNHPVTLHITRARVNEDSHTHTYTHTQEEPHTHTHTHIQEERHTDTQISLTLTHSHTLSQEKRREWVKNKDAILAEDPLYQPPPLSESIREDGQYPTVKAMDQIVLDLDRTFYTHRMFVEKNGPGQRALFNVLAVYARCV